MGLNLKVATAFTRTFNTANAGSTIAIKLSKNAGAFANPNVGASNLTELTGGWYKFALDSTDTDTLGSLSYQLLVAGNPILSHIADLVDQVWTNTIDTLSAGSAPTIRQITKMVDDKFRAYIPQDS